MKLVCCSAELSQTSKQVQIIPPGKSTGFDIIFHSSDDQKFSGYAKYIINKKYEFFFQVVA